MKSILKLSWFALLVCVALPAGTHPQQGFQVKVMLQKDLSTYAGRDIVLSVGEVTIPPGAAGSFYEDAHQLHISTKNVSATEPARILAYHLSHKGEPLTQPER